jgi:hypothetical protein
VTEQALARANEFLRAPAAARLLSLFVAIAIAIVFSLAALVEPSPAGHGTHLQLGLGQCTFLQATGWPCPMCGATTTFSLMAHLRPLDAFGNQPFAASLFLLSSAILAVSISEVVDPRGRWKAILRWIEPVESLLAVFFLAAMGIGWAYKAWTWGG